MMDKVECATLKWLDTLYRNSQLPMDTCLGIEMEHQVTHPKHGRARYLIKVTHIPVINESNDGSSNG